MSENLNRDGLELTNQIKENIVDNFIQQFAGWQFLNEPLYRWFLFGLAFMGMTWGWNGVISLMK